MSDAIVHATDATFDQEVLQSPVPVLVDFWATWCPPCRAIAPALEELALEYAGRARIVKIDVDAAREIPAKFNVRNIPNLILFKGGHAVENVVGAMPKSKFAALLDKHI